MSEIIREEELEEQEPQEERFEVVDDEKADWCIDKIKEHKGEIEKWNAHYEAEKRRRFMRHETAIFRLTAKLRDYFINRSEQGLTNKTKTEENYKLPGGKIFMKKREPEFTKDEAALIPWLEEHAPEYVKIEKSVDWAGLKKAFWAGGTELVMVDDETGEIIQIPGVAVTPRDPEFKVKEN